MKQPILLLLAKLNFIFPNFLGFSFIRYKSFLRQNRAKYNNEKSLLKIVDDAKKNVPFYKANIANQINSIDDFEKNVPLIDKDTVMAQWDKFLTDNLDKSKIVEGTTGGTSGKPLRLVIPKNRFIFELNTLFPIWNINTGWNGHVRAVIRNKKLQNNQTFIVDPIQKQVIFDGFRSDNSYYEEIYQTIKALKINYIHAYPSSAYQFSLFLFKNNKETSFIKAFLCGSEAITDLQRQLITFQLGITICGFYGHSEKLIIGGPCPGNDAFHIEPTYGYFELVDDDGNVIKEPGKVGEMVGTTLHNTYMPLIRYKTGDFAEYAGNYCEHCKRHLPLIKNIQGRWDKNKIYLSDGSYVSITALNLHSDLYLCIEGMQYVQKKKGEFDIYLIKGNGFNTQVEQRFKEHFEQALLGKCEFKIIYTDKIPKEPNGKFLPLKQLVDERNLV